MRYCVICNNEICTPNMLIPAKCFIKNGYEGHEICHDCWFTKFAIEDKCHKCPGCNKKRKRKN